MKIIKHLSLLMVDSKAIFKSSPSGVSLKIRAVPSSGAFKFLDGKAIWCKDVDELDEAKDYIEIYIAEVELNAGKGILQHWGSEQPISIVLCATQNQISELLKLNLSSQQIQINIGGDDKDSYMDGSFTLSKEDYPIDSWSIEISL